METGKRNINGGEEFERFFTNKPEGNYITIKKDGAETLADTIPLMKKVVSTTLKDTAKIAQFLQVESVKKTCKRIWDFCFKHFQYEKDEERKEQIRRPIRSWFDRRAGIDCDCLTVLIGSILTNLGLPYVMRLTYYKDQDDYSHIYPVAFAPNGEEIIIDCVVHKFNYEVPYEAKRDEQMELQYLNGIESEDQSEFDTISFDNNLPIDAQDLFEDDLELLGLEGKAEREARKKKRKDKREKRRETPLKERVKEKLKKGLNVINKVNPATMLLRAGVLASMKLNLFKVASTLRFAYWSTEQARKNEMDMSKFNQLQRIREKLEKIYYGAGGKTSALKKAILTGKGNRNKMVQLNGLGEIIQNVNDEDDLRTILGEDLFFDELNGFEGLGGLGEPATIATGAAVTAASGVIAVIARLIKKLGGLFKKGSQSDQKFKIQDNTDNSEEKTRRFSFKNLINRVKNKIQERREQRRSEKGGEETNFSTELEPMEPLPEGEFDLDENFVTTRSAEGDPTEPDTDSDDDSDSKGIKKWIQENKNLAIGIGSGIVIGGTALTIYLVNRAKKKKGKGVNGVEGLEGCSKKTTKSSSKKAAEKKFIPKSRGKKKGSTSKKKPSIQKVELL